MPNAIVCMVQCLRMALLIVSVLVKRRRVALFLCTTHTIQSRFTCYGSRGPISMPAYSLNMTQRGFTRADPKDRLVVLFTQFIDLEVQCLCIADSDSLKGAPFVCTIYKIQDDGRIIYKLPGHLFC